MIERRKNPCCCERFFLLLSVRKPQIICSGSLGRRKNNIFPVGKSSFSSSNKLQTKNHDVVFILGWHQCIAIERYMGFEWETARQHNQRWHVQIRQTRRPTCKRNLLPSRIRSIQSMPQIGTKKRH